MECIIYGLYDPRNQQLRYVGKTNRPKGRLSYHMNDRRNTHKGRWIMQLDAIGLTPIMRIIERLPNDDSIWPERECYWIQRAKELGCKLTNIDEGGLSGFKKHPDSIEKIRQSKLGIKQSPETKAKRSAAMMGHATSLETRSKISVAHIGITQSEASRIKIREARARQANVSIIGLVNFKGQKRSFETRLKMSNAQKDRVTSPETKLKQRQAKLGKSLGAEHRAKLCIAQKLRWAQKKALQLS